MDGVIEELINTKPCLVCGYDHLELAYIESEETEVRVVCIRCGFKRSLK